MEVSKLSAQRSHDARVRLDQIDGILCAAQEKFPQTTCFVRLLCVVAPPADFAAATSDIVQDMQKKVTEIAKNYPKYDIVLTGQLACKLLAAKKTGSEWPHYSLSLNTQICIHHTLISRLGLLVW